MRPLIAGLALLLGLAGSARAEDVSALVKRLQKGDADSRRSAAKALADAGDQARTAVPALQRALSDRDKYVRRFAAQSLGALGKASASSISSLGTLAKSQNEDEQVRAAAVEAIGKIGGLQAVRPLGAVAEDAKLPAALRVKAVGLMAAIKPDTRDARNYASSATYYYSRILKAKERDKDVSMETLRAVQKLGAQSAAAVPAVAGLLKDGDRDVKRLAADVLVASGKQARPAIPQLLKVLKSDDNDRQLKHKAAVALGGIGPDAISALPTLKRIASDATEKDDRLRALASDAVKKIEAKPVKPKK
jgi:HEAT repeat protein